MEINTVKEKAKQKEEPFGELVMFQINNNHNNKKAQVDLLQI